MENTDPNLLLKQARVKIGKNEYDEALTILKNALLSIEKRHPINVKQRLETLLLMAEVNHVIGDWVEALMYLDAVVQTSTDRRLAALRGEALITSGSILSKKGKWDTAKRKFEQAQELADSEGHPHIKGKAMVSTGVILWRKGEGEEAIQLANKAIALAEEIKNDEIIGSAHALVASVRFDMAQFGESVEASKASLVHYKKAENLFEISRVLNNLGETYKVMGEYDLAIEQFNEGMGIVEETGVKRSIGYLLMNLAECHIRKRQVEKAKLYAHKALEAVQDQEDVYLLAYIKFVWALIHDYGGKSEAAEGEYEAALSKMMALGIPFDVGLFQMDYARSSLRRGMKDKAALLFKEAARCFNEAGSRTLAEQAKKELEALA